MSDLAETPLQPMSPLGVARARRRLTVEEAAARARLAPDVVRALEENRLYRFPSVRDAVAATLVYATALGIGEREARGLAGLPMRSRLRVALSLRRALASVALLAALAALGWFVVVPRLEDDPPPPAPVAAPAPPAPDPGALPEQWRIRVDVLNGSTRPGAAASVANAVAAHAYAIGDVEDAPRQDYPQTRVYFPPGADGIAERLADELGVGTQALPGGDDPLRLLVIVGRSAPRG